MIFIFIYDSNIYYVIVANISIKGEVFHYNLGKNNSNTIIK